MDVCKEDDGVGSRFVFRVDDISLDCSDRYSLFFDQVLNVILTVVQQLDFSTRGTLMFDDRCFQATFSWWMRCHIDELVCLSQRLNLRDVLLQR
jgi:hypothetical protein